MAELLVETWNCINCDRSWEQLLAERSAHDHRRKLGQCYRTMVRWHSGRSASSLNFTLTKISVKNERIARFFPFLIFFPVYKPYEANKSQRADVISRSRSRDKKYFVKFVLSGRVWKFSRFSEKWKWSLNGKKSKKYAPNCTQNFLSNGGSLLKNGHLENFQG